MLFIGIVLRASFSSLCTIPKWYLQKLNISHDTFENIHLLPRHSLRTGHIPPLPIHLDLFLSRHRILSLKSIRFLLRFPLPPLPYLRLTKPPLPNPPQSTHPQYSHHPRRRNYPSYSCRKAPNGRRRQCCDDRCYGCVFCVANYPPEYKEGYGV